MKPITCKPEVGDTERLLCPGDPQGPARRSGELTSLNKWLLDNKVTTHIPPSHTSQPTSLPLR